MRFRRIVLIYPNFNIFLNKKFLELIQGSGALGVVSSAVKMVGWGIPKPTVNYFQA